MDNTQHTRVGSKMTRNYPKLSDADIDDDDDDDDDEEFVESDENFENDNVTEGDDNNEGDEGNDERQIIQDKRTSNANAIILQGFFYVNDEGYYVYSGTWTMQRDLNADKPQENQPNDTENGKDKKKKRKFKLKSKKQINNDTAGGSAFEKKKVIDILSIVGGTDEANYKPQSILFDGFFVTDDTDKIKPHRRVKERDVEFTFSRLSNPSTRGSSSGNEESSSPKRRYRVEGRGANEFGAFLIEGTYTHLQQAVKKDDKDCEVSTASQCLTCRKWYIPIIKPRKRNSDEGSCGEDYGDGSNDDDHEISGDERTDFDEIIGLQDEAHMSIEELRKRYYGEGEIPDGKDIQNGKDTKRQKLMEDDSDDGCGF